MQVIHPEGTFKGQIIDWREPREHNSELHRGIYSIGLLIKTEHGEVWASLAGYPSIVSAMWRNRERVNHEVRVRVRHRKVEDRTYPMTDLVWKEDQ